MSGARCNADPAIITDRPALADGFFEVSERDYQDLKQELGLGHYEGRGWRGLHHHATLCIAAYAFLVSERSLIPPSGPGIATVLQILAVPADYRPRGAPAENPAARR